MGNILRPANPEVEQRIIPPKGKWVGVVVKKNKKKYIF